MSPFIVRAMIIFIEFFSQLPFRNFFSYFSRFSKVSAEEPFCLSLLIMVYGCVNGKLQADGRLSIFNTTFHQYKIPFCFCHPFRERIMGGINVFASWQTSRVGEGDKIEIIIENAERVSSMCPPD